MNTRDPKIVALQFNESINNQDLNGLTLLISEDHTFVDREGNAHSPKQTMVQGWKEFFETFSDYGNIFNRVESMDNLVVILGYAYWTEKEPYDPVIWTGTIVDDLVQEWRVYIDREVNRRLFNLL